MVSQRDMNFLKLLHELRVLRGKFLCSILPTPNEKEPNNCTVFCAKYVCGCPKPPPSPLKPLKQVQGQGRLYPLPEGAGYSG